MKAKIFTLFTIWTIASLSSFVVAQEPVLILVEENGTEVNQPSQESSFSFPQETTTTTTTTTEPSSFDSGFTPVEEEVFTLTFEDEDASAAKAAEDARLKAEQEAAEQIEETNNEQNDEQDNTPNDTPSQEQPTEEVADEQEEDDFENNPHSIETILGGGVVADASYNSDFNGRREVTFGVSNDPEYRPDEEDNDTYKA